MIENSALQTEPNARNEVFRSGNEVWFFSGKDELLSKGQVTQIVTIDTVIVKFLKDFTADKHDTRLDKESIYSSVDALPPRSSRRSRAESSSGIERRFSSTAKTIVDGLPKQDTPPINSPTRLNPFYPHDNVNTENSDGESEGVSYPISSDTKSKSMDGSGVAACKRSRGNSEKSRSVELKESVRMKREELVVGIRETRARTGTTSTVKPFTTSGPSSSSSSSVRPPPQPKATADLIERLKRDREATPRKTRTRSLHQETEQDNQTHATLEVLPDMTRRGNSFSSSSNSGPHAKSRDARPSGQSKTVHKTTKEGANASIRQSMIRSKSKNSEIRRSAGEREEVENMTSTDHRPKLDETSASFSVDHEADEKIVSHGRPKKHIAKKDTEKGCEELRQQQLLFLAEEAQAKDAKKATESKEAIGPSLYRQLCHLQDATTEGRFEGDNGDGDDDNSGSGSMEDIDEVDEDEVDGTEEDEAKEQEDVGEVGGGVDEGDDDWDDLCAYVGASLDEKVRLSGAAGDEDSSQLFTVHNSKKPRLDDSADGRDAAGQSNVELDQQSVAVPTSQPPSEPISATAVMTGMKTVTSSAITVTASVTAVTTSVTAVTASAFQADSMSISSTIAADTAAGRPSTDERIQVCHLA